VLEPSPPDIKKEPKHRFWNCFGIGNPAEQHMLTITVEINPPHEGEDRRVAGLFARDEDSRIYIAHTGKVGGGRKGIGPNAFRKFLGDRAWHEIETQGGRRTAVALGPIDAPDFPNQLAEFVHKVADFKESVALRPRA
jgi:5-methylcytosine-specific restriction enzyme A